MPVVLLGSAKEPLAVFWKPVVLFWSALTLVAVLLSPETPLMVVLLKSASTPLAVFPKPAMLLIERTNTGGCVAAAGCVEKKRISTTGHVLAAGGLCCSRAC